MEKYFLTDHSWNNEDRLGLDILFLDTSWTVLKARESILEKKRNLLFFIVLKSKKITKEHVKNCTSPCNNKIFQPTVCVGVAPRSIV